MSKAIGFLTACFYIRYEDVRQKQQVVPSMDACVLHLVCLWLFISWGP